MALFDFSKRKQRQPEQTASGPLEERVRALESAHRQLEADFVDLWDRFTRFQGRTVKRAAREEQQLELTPEEQINQRIKQLRMTSRFLQEQ